MDGSDAVADKWEPLLLANCLCQKLQLKLKTDEQSQHNSTRKVDLAVQTDRSGNYHFISHMARK